MRKASLRDVGQLLGLELPRPGFKSKCPFRSHKRRDKTFRVFRARSTGDELWKCWSCDPPDNVGDAVGFYARYGGLDREKAVEELRQKGFDVGSQADRRTSTGPRRTYRGPPPIPVNGTRRGPFLTIDMGLWRKWKKAEPNELSKFADMRRLSVNLLVDHDVLEPAPGCVGFGYRDPSTSLPCRVKVRSIESKKFWVEPRGHGGQLSAQSPLYLAHRLEPQLGQDELVIITEGEVDALTLRHLGYENVVSLPDGASSASNVDVEPIVDGYAVWLVSTDNDPDGQQAYRVLRRRARELGIDVVRLSWAKIVAEDKSDELMEFKDANEALMAGLTRRDFDECIRISTERYLGYPMSVR